MFSTTYMYYSGHSCNLLNLSIGDQQIQSIDLKLWEVNLLNKHLSSHQGVYSQMANLSKHHNPQAFIRVVFIHMVTTWL